MRIRNLSALSSLCLSLSVCLFVGAAGSASASEGPRYITLRIQHNYDRKLTYAAVQNSPAAYVGRVFELRGTVGGTAEAGQGLTAMLNLPDKSSVTLDIPRSEMGLLREYDTPNLRVLVQVGAGGGGNVAPLKVIALAHDSAVTAIEAQQAARIAAEEAAARRHRRQQQQYADAARRSTTPSRGGDYIRYLPNSPDVQSLVAYYQNILSARTKPLFVPYLNFVASQNRQLATAQAGQITAGLLYFADKYDVDPRLIVAMVIAESNFNPNSTSRTGAMGLGQLMPGTARALGVNNAYDPIDNLHGSINYLRSRLDTYAAKALPDGTRSLEQIALAMAAYNAGTNAVKKYGGVPPYRETQAYVRRVISLYRQLCGEG